MTENPTTNLTAKARVLLVDDEPMVTQGLTRALMDAPYVFIPVQSAASALEVLGRIPIDVIVCDEKMPEMQGSELLTEVRKLYPDVIRIMLTGHASVQSAITAIEDGCVYQYLHKPCNPADLASCIHNGLVLRAFMGRGSALAMSSKAQEELLERVAAAPNGARQSGPPWRFE